MMPKYLDFIQYLIRVVSFNLKRYQKFVDSLSRLQVYGSDEVKAIELLTKLNESAKILEKAARQLKAKKACQNASLIKSSAKTALIDIKHDNSAITLKDDKKLLNKIPYQLL